MWFLGHSFYKTFAVLDVPGSHRCGSWDTVFTRLLASWRLFDDNSTAMIWKAEKNDIPGTQDCGSWTPLFTGLWLSWTLLEAMGVVPGTQFLQDFCCPGPSWNTGLRFLGPIIYKALAVLDVPGSHRCGFMGHSFYKTFDVLDVVRR